MRERQIPGVPFKAGHTPWNKGKFGYKMPPSSDEKKLKSSMAQTGVARPQTTGEKNGFWKGDDAGYGAIHNWVYRQLGRPMVCTHCHDDTRKMYHWANISGLYKRVLSDWVRLCVPCHKKYDLGLIEL